MLVASWFALSYRYAWAGFHPTDDGFILAQAARLLHREVPHTDFFSPRPVGSPLLHVVDLLLPGPLMPVSRFVTMAELFAGVAGSVMLATGRGLKSLRPIDVAVIPAGAVISAQTFPLMAWHTVDGLLVGVASLLMLRSGIRRSSVSAVAIGGALAGFAPLVKQSHAAVPIIALAWFIV